MSSKKTTTSNQQQSVTYNPNSLNTYNTLQNPASSLLQTYMKDPYAALKPQYDVQLNLENKQATQLGNRNMENFMQNMNAGGFSGSNLNALTASQLAKNSRATSGLQSNALLQNRLQMLNEGNQMQQMALGEALSYRPLVTGGTSSGQSTETTSGTGTWLPQLISAGIGAAAAPFTGGASLLTAGGQNLGNYSASNVYGMSPSVWGGMSGVSPMSAPTMGYGGVWNPYTSNNAFLGGY